ncbi:hypothetical protein [Halorubrum sp. SD683]|uniref:hypothetical protein n=1 Tax=Halorubrum sp. SD683 TaxID=1855873 RepID=UPI001302ABE4|nr:hypothetical protein [Halorubrum sp. SD683]
MVPTGASETPRRRFLGGLGVCIASLLAGCSGSETGEGTEPDDGTLVTEYTVETTRSSGDEPPIVAPREHAGNDDTSATAEPLTTHTVGSEQDAEELRFAEDATNVAAVRRLVAETAYASESVLLFQASIGECYRRELNAVRRDADGDPDVDFCRVVRDADVDCERRAREYAASAVRLPFPGDEYGGLTVGSGGSCDPVPERDRNGGGSA